MQEEVKMIDEQERYAAEVSAVLAEHGLLLDEDAPEMRRLLRGW